MRTIWHFIIEAVVNLTLIFALLLCAYFFDLVLSGLHQPELMETHPCYQNPVGKVAKRWVEQALQPEGGQVPSEGYIRTYPN